MAIICVDVDGVLAKYEGWKGIEHFGPPADGAREFLTELMKFCSVWINTTRTNSELNKSRTPEELKQLVEDWLTENDLPFDVISTGGKPRAVRYLDDRAELCLPDTKDNGFDAVLARCKAAVLGTNIENPGEIDGLEIAVIEKEESVRIEFGKPISWFALSKREAISLANLILDKAGVTKEDLEF